MESLLSLAMFGSFIWLCVIVGLLFIAFFWSENVEQGGIAFVAVVVFVTINHFWGNLPLKNYVSWMNALAYFSAGLVYAVIRTYFYGRNRPDSDSSYLKGNVFRWWFLWPVSLINWMVCDLVKDLWDWLYQRLETMFEYFYTLGQRSMKKK